MEKYPCGRHVPPPKLTRAEVEREFASGDPERIIHALYGAFFTVFPDREIGRRHGAPDQKREPANWVQDWCFKFVTHTDPGVRAKAIIILGNLAGCGAETDFDRAIAAAKRLVSDDTIRSYAEDALGDLQHARKLAERPGRA